MPLRLRIHDLQFIHPFRDSVIIHLLDRELVGYVLGHDSLVIAVHLSTGQVDQPEAVLFLQADDVLGSDGIALPHGFVEVLAVDASKLGREVVNKVEVLRVEKALKLAVQSVMITPVEDPDLVAFVP
jgi:hypothetical protein